MMAHGPNGAHATTRQSKPSRSKMARSENHLRVLGVLNLGLKTRGQAPESVNFARPSITRGIGIRRVALAESVANEARS